MLIDRVIFVCTLLLTGAYFYGILNIPTLEIGDPLGPRAFPYMICIGLLLSAAWLLLEMARAKKSSPSGTPPPAPARESSETRHWLMLAGVVVWISIYFALFERLGFLLATPPFLLALMAYFNREKWLANGLTAVLFTIGTYVLFSKVLGVSLAKGLLGI